MEMEIWKASKGPNGQSHRYFSVYFYPVKCSRQCNYRVSASFSDDLTVSTLKSLRKK